MESVAHLNGIGGHEPLEDGEIVLVAVALHVEGKEADVLCSTK